MRNLEDQHQEALCQWAKLQPVLQDYFIYIPNEGKRTKRVGAKFKRMGLLAGASDNFIAIPMGMKHGLWLELKAPKPFGRPPTERQARFLKHMEMQGYATAVCYGWPEARDTIIYYLTESNRCKLN